MHGRFRADEKKKRWRVHLRPAYVCAQQQRALPMHACHTVVACVCVWFIHLTHRILPDLALPYMRVYGHACPCAFACLPQPTCTCLHLLCPL